MKKIVTLFFALLLFNSYGSVDVGATLLVAPTTPMCAATNQTVTVRIMNYDAGTIDFSVDNVTVTVNVNSTCRS
jgi:hypothetical protein